MSSKLRVFTCLVLLVAAIGFVGCSKKPKNTGNTTAPAMTGPAPTAQLTATPASISAGDQVVLSWRTTDATSISIDGIGAVPSAGVKTVTPTESTSYHLVARGDGGSADATARVTVTAIGPTAVPNDMSSSNLTEEEAFKANVQDIFFDYDSYEVRETDQASLSKSAAYLAQHPALKVLIGGYCDERGSNEYNLTLGQSRGDSVKKALVAAGVAPDRLRVVSYGKEKPFCTESTEECWQQNRRAGFSLDR